MSHDFTEILPDTRRNIIPTKVVIWWTSGNDLHVLEMNIMYWGLLVALRCALQSSDFSLNGTHTEPEILEYPVRFIPYFKVVKYPNCSYKRLNCTIEEGIHNLNLALDDGIHNLNLALDDEKAIAFSQSQDSRIVQRSDFISLLRPHLMAQEVDAYYVRKNHYLKFKATCDKNDDDYWDEQEFCQLQCNLLNIIDQEWIEIDSAEVFRCI